MTAFIRQEALEKAREIQLKADEEFAIEKSQLVRQETSSIDASYEKKFKQAGMSQQITKSTLANKTRLRLLSARQELLNDLFEQASTKIGDFTNDNDKYQDILKNLILEGMYALNEKKVYVRCRTKDNDVAQKAAKDASAEYKEKLNGREVDVSIDEDEKLPEGSYVVPLFLRPHILGNANNSSQRRRCLHSQRHWQNRHQQYLRGAPPSSRIRGSPERQSHFVRREPQQEVQGLNSYCTILHCLCKIGRVGRGQGEAFVQCREAGNYIIPVFSAIQSCILPACVVDIVLSVYIYTMSPRLS